MSARVRVCVSVSLSVSGDPFCPQLRPWLDVRPERFELPTAAFRTSVGAWAREGVRTGLEEHSASRAPGAGRRTVATIEVPDLVERVAPRNTRATWPEYHCEGCGEPAAELVIITQVDAILWATAVRPGARAALGAFGAAAGSGRVGR